MSGATKSYGAIRRCWSCKAGGNEPCWPGCQCGKCLDPEGYAVFKNSIAYDEWLQSVNLSTADDKELKT